MRYGKELGRLKGIITKYTLSHSELFGKPNKTQKEVQRMNKANQMIKYYTPKLKELEKLEFDTQEKVAENYRKWIERHKSQTKAPLDTVVFPELSIIMNNTMIIRIDFNKRTSIEQKRELIFEAFFDYCKITKLETEKDFSPDHYLFMTRVVTRLKLTGTNCFIEFNLS